MKSSLELLAEYLGQQMTESGISLVVAESCTGGWVAKLMTDIAGSSLFFDRGYVTYSNEAKHEMLGVKEKTLEIHGAVSEQTVSEMVSGALTKSHAGVALAISGIAGPGGGTPDKPVGTVWFAWKKRDQGIMTRIMHLEGNRDSIRRQAVERALNGVLELLE